MTAGRDARPPGSVFGLMTVATAFFFDLPFGRGEVFVDVFPDVVGYLLFVVAGVRLAKTAPETGKRLTLLAALLVPLGLLALAQGLFATHFGLATAAWGLVYFLAGTATAVLEVLLVFTLAGYVAHLGASMARPALGERATRRRNLFIAYVAVVWLMPPPAVFRFGTVIILLLGAFAVAFLALLMVETRRLLNREAEAGDAE